MSKTSTNIFSGSVTLCFADGSEADVENCWDEENRIYTCGDNTVSVKGDVAVDFTRSYRLVLKLHKSN